MMHELSLMADLMKKIEKVRYAHGGGRVSRVKVWLGALSHLSAEHFQDHFVQVSRGTACDGAALDIEVSEDVGDPRAQEVVLCSVDMEVEATEGLA